MKVLVVEDDASVLEVICTSLRQEHYVVDACTDGEEGYLLAKQGIFDVLVLDIMLPNKDGLSIVKELRRKSVDTPILLLTARDGVDDRVRGLDVGADDYLTKPFAVSELVARVRALARRKAGIHIDNKLTYGKITVKTDLHDGYIDTEPMKLTIKEYELLEFFVRNPERILTKEQIFDRVWGFESDSASNVVDVYVHHLRKKLAAFQCHSYVKTIRGVGYMLKETQ
ncbi:response regulator transcription factor [Bacillus timonensis]|nr:response regulator transcription factor [Bacillus timonensis]